MGVGISTGDSEASELAVFGLPCRIRMQGQQAYWDLVEGYRNQLKQQELSIMINLKESLNGRAGFITAVTWMIEGL